MQRSEILSKLKTILAKALPDKTDILASVDESSDLRTQVGLNSIGMLCMVIMIEEEFKVQFDDVGFNDFITVGDVIDYIQGK